MPCGAARAALALRHGKGGYDILARYVLLRFLALSECGEDDGLRALAAEGAAEAAGGELLGCLLRTPSAAGGEASGCPRGLPGLMQSTDFKRSMLRCSAM